MKLVYSFALSKTIIFTKTLHFGYFSMNPQVQITGCTIGLIGLTDMETFDRIVIIYIILIKLPTLKTKTVNVIFLLSI